MSCSWASRLISPVVDGSDDKTTTFTVLLFNFHLFPLDLPLHNWFLCAFICLPFTSIHLSPLFPWCFFLSFQPSLSWINVPFSYLIVFFYTSLHFSSLFVPFQFPCCLLSFSPSCETNALPFIFVLFYPAASSVWLFIALSSSLCLVSSLLLVWYSSCSSSHPCEPALLLFPPFSSSVRWSFGFQYSHIPRRKSLDASALTQSWASLICLSSFLPPCPLRRSVIEHWGKVKEKKNRLVPECKAR